MCVLLARRRESSVCPTPEVGLTSKAGDTSGIKRSSSVPDALGPPFPFGVWGMLTPPVDLVESVPFEKAYGVEKADAIFDACAWDWDCPCDGGWPG